MMPSIAAIALNLLFGVPPFVAGLMTAVVAFGILELQTRGHRKFELAITGFLAIVFLGFLYDLLQVGVDARAFAQGLVPHFDGTLITMSPDRSEKPSHRLLSVRPLR